MPIEETRVTCRVASLKQFNHDIMQVILEPLNTAPLPFHAGQYITLFLDDEGERPFSLANAPRQDNLIELHIRHNAGGGVARWLEQDGAEETELEIGGPHGDFRLHESDRPIIMVAGGTGFAPIKSLIEQIIQEGVNRDVYLYWGARRREDLYLESLAKQWARIHPNIHFIPVLSEETVGAGIRTGLVHEAVLEDFSSLTGFEVYVCGPPAMIQTVRERFLKRGLDPDAIYSDMFAFIDE